MESELVNGLVFNKKPTNETLANLIALHGPDLPNDYLEFMSLHDGAEGDVGQNYISIWPIQDVIQITQFHRTHQTAYHQFIILGSSGYFHYCIYNRMIYELDLIDDEYREAIGSSFSEFLQAFSKRQW
ncbi:hypothetical protein BWI93_25935 [Siphonobacter sp. BAB-5385]|uniref:SMI1/KNR4 family protein n=1 Tax=Siphonobacter sp. BAB-5385 TaxID=1864822 RepID=UPI000B9E3D7F|nr:SMI1/KNR4 family protein [Siphonobacter sp. BAB-5385]OZI05352.1 hypothetical protein BWI93_25935 [Siphonobacter sp. BAB-5385]